MKFGERKTIPPEHRNDLKAEEQKKASKFAGEMRAGARQREVLGNFKARKSEWVDSLTRAKSSPDRPFRKRRKPEEHPGYIDNLTEEQVARILGLESIEEVPKKGEFPLRGGAKLVIADDGRVVLYGYSPDGKDVKDIMRALEKGESNLRS